MKKFLFGLLAFLSLLLIVLFALPLLFKNEINARIKDEINKRYTAKIDYTGFNLDIFRQFPNLTFSLDELTVSGNDSSKNDTLAYIRNLNLTIDLMSVVKGEKYKLLALNFIHPEINARIDSSGKNNWDIFKNVPSTGGKPVPVTESSDFSFEINRCKIEDGNINFSNQKNNIFLQINGLSFTGNGNMSNEIYDMSTQASCNELSYKTGTITYLNKTKAKTQINLVIDKKSGKYTFNENSVCINDLCLQLNGNIATGADTTILDISFQSKQNELQNILSLIPSVYSENLNKTKTSGTVELDGRLKGFYNDSSSPSLRLNLKAENGMFEKPGFPSPLKNISLAVNITKPQGRLDSVNVDIERLHFESNKSDLTASGKLENIIGWYTGKDQLTGVLNLSSKKFVVNEWLPENKKQLPVNTPKTSTSNTGIKTVDTSYFKVPERLNLTVNCRLTELDYDKLILNNVTGIIQTGNDGIALKNFSLNAFSGNAKINARYLLQGKNRPHIDFSCSTDNCDIQQTYKALPALGKFSASSQYMQGRFSSALKGDGELMSRTDLDYNSLVGNGQIILINTTVSGIPVLDEISKMAKIKSLQNLETKNAVSKFNFKDGKIETEPTEIKFTNGYQLQLNGYSTFNHIIDYDMRLDVPSKDFGSVASLAKNLLSGIPGINLNLPETVIFYFKVSGDFNKPDVKLSNVSTK